MIFSYLNPPVLKASLQFAAVFLLALSWSTDLLGFVPSGTDANDSRWLTTANGFAGFAGDPVKLTWSIVPDNTSTVELNGISRSPSNLIASFDAAFGAGPGGSDLTQRPWFTHFEQAFDRISDLAGITYIYEPNDDGVSHGGASGQLGGRGDIRVAGLGLDGLNGTLAYNYFPDAGGGDMALDTDDAASFADPTNAFRFLRNTIMHEAGHGLGLEHVGSSNVDILMAPSISEDFDGPQHDDLRGLHWFYGDALEKAPAGRNETFSLASSLGLLLDASTLTVGAGGSGSSIGSFETDFVSIANENDTDFFSFTIDEAVRLDAVMTPRGANYTQNGSPFVTTATNDLELALFDTNGTSLLAESNSSAAGVTESIDSFLLTTPGTYFARIKSTSNEVGRVVQFYQLDLAADSLLPDLLGDFNEDGVVDAADYTVWRDSEGQSVAAFTGADHDGNGSIGSGDYTLWANNFGQSSASFATAVPEPASWALVASAITVLTGRRRRLF